MFVRVTVGREVELLIGVAVGGPMSRFQTEFPNHYNLCTCSTQKQQQTVYFSRPAGTGYPVQAKYGQSYTLCQTKMVEKTFSLRPPCHVGYRRLPSPQGKGNVLTLILSKMHSCINRFVLYLSFPQTLFCPFLSSSC